MPAASVLALAAMVVGGLVITAPRTSPATGAAASGPGAATVLPVSGTSAVRHAVGELQDTRYLELVNRDHEITSMPAAEDLVSLIGRVPTPGTATSISLRPAAAEATAALMAAAQEATGGTAMVTSGFRGHARQAELFAAAADQRYVLPAGHSEHHTGLAIDVQVQGRALAELGQSPQGRWITENSWRFGLILRYPEGSEAVTGVAFEPWHFRYVGKIHAAYMTQHGLILEQYLEHLRQAGEVSVEVDGGRYTISYQTADGGTLALPGGADPATVTVSSSNLGGYVITTRG